MGQKLCQFGTDPTSRVVILTENNAAVLQPGPALSAMLGEKIRHGRKLRVAGLGACKFLDDVATVAKDLLQPHSRILTAIGPFSEAEFEGWDSP